MNYNMAVFCVLLAYAFLPFSVESLYSGDECFVKNDRGICMPLAKCKPWMDEIHGMGPLATNTRRKLQEIGCGFDGESPLICCVNSRRNEFDHNTGPFNWEKKHDPRIENSNDYSNEDMPQLTFHTNNRYDSNKESDDDHKVYTSRPINDHNYNQNNDHNTQTNRPTYDFYRPTKDENDNNVNGNNFNTQTNRPVNNDYRPSQNRSNNNLNNNYNTPTSRPNNYKPTQSENNNIMLDNKQSLPDISRHRNLDLLPRDCGLFEDNRIWGGNRTSLYEMPWMVLMSYDSPRGNKYSCGATLISKWYLLTAAHCVSHLGKMTLSGGILGEHDIRDNPDCERNEGILVCSPPAINVTFTKVLPHPGYSPQNLYDDIALVKLSQPADFKLDNVKPICLPTTSELMNEDLTGLQGVVTGWGATEDGIQSPVLLRVELPVIANRECQVTYNGDPKIYERQMCAGGLQDKDSCGGDSGGPLLYPGRIGAGSIRYIQRGIVSFGSKRCGVGGFPGVYTRVAYYMDWILDNLDE